MKANLSYRLVIVGMIISIIAGIMLMAGTQTVYAEDPEPKLYVMGEEITEDQPVVKITDNNWYGLATYDFSSNTLTIQSTKEHQEGVDPEVEEWSKAGIKVKGGFNGQGIDEAAIYAENMNLTIELDKAYCEISGGSDDKKTAGIYVSNGDLKITGEGVFNIRSSGGERYSIYTSKTLTVFGSVNVQCGNNINTDNEKQIGIEAGKDIEVCNGASINARLSADSGKHDLYQAAVKAGGVIIADSSPNVPYDAPESFKKYYTNNDNAKYTINAETDSSVGGTATAIEASKYDLDQYASVHAEAEAICEVVNNKYVPVSGELAVAIKGNVGMKGDSSITVSGEPNIGIKGSVRAIDNSNITVKASARAESEATGILLPDDTSEEANLVILNKARIEASGSQAAISGADDAAIEKIKEFGAMVGETSAEVADWDLNTPLSSYKYVSIPGNYPIKVGGVPVGRNNQDDVLDDGTVSYAPDTRTLTLKGASIGTSENHEDAGIWTTVQGLNIVLEDTNTLNAGSTGIAAENTDVTISGEGSLDINVNGSGNQTYIKGIVAKTFAVDTSKLNITCENGKADDMTSSADTDQTAGIYTTGNSVALKDAGLEININIPEKGDASGIFVTNNSTFDGSVKVEGQSEVKINIADEGNSSRSVTGITSSNIHGNRKAPVVTISDSSKVNIDTSAAKADAADGDGFNGGIYGTVAVTGTSALTVKAGYGGTVAFGAGWNQKMTFGGGDTFFTDITAADDAQISLTSGGSAKETYAALCSVIASDNAKVEAKAGAADNGTSSGTAPYQGVVTSGKASVTVTGATYGTGMIIAADSSKVIAQGGTRAVSGAVNKSSQYFDGKDIVFPVDLTGYTGYAISGGKVKSPNVDVNTKATSTGMTGWNGTAALGGESSSFKYVKIPGRADNTLKVTGKTYKIKASRIKKRTVTVTRKKAIKITSYKGKLTYKKGTLKYKKLSKSKLKKLAKKFSINKKTGKITIKKGLKKGTYKLQVKVTASGNSSFKPKTKTVTVTFKVK